MCLQDTMSLENNIFFVIVCLLIPRVAGWVYSLVKSIKPLTYMYKYNHWGKAHSNDSDKPRKKQKHTKKKKK